MIHQKNISLLLFLTLVGWYLLVFFPVPGLHIDGKAALLSLMGLLLLLLALTLGGYLLRWKYADFPALLVLSLWGYLQFNANWRYWLVKAPPDTVEAYNNYFSGTFRIFPPSEIYTVPDAYHIILGILLFLNLGVVIGRIASPLLKRNKVPAA